MTARRESFDEPGHGSFGGRLLLLAAVVLAVGATAVLVLSDDQKYLRLGIIAGLWAALAGAFVAARYRRQVAEREDDAAERQERYELELEREIAARREHELVVEAEARRKAEEAARDDISALRAELHGLRSTLQTLLGGDYLVERYALRAESTRMRSLSEAAPLPEPKRLAAAQRIDAEVVQPDEREADTDLINRVRGSGDSRPAGESRSSSQPLPRRADRSPAQAQERFQQFGPKPHPTEMSDRWFMPDGTGSEESDWRPSWESSRDSGAGRRRADAPRTPTNGAAATNGRSSTSTGRPSTNGHSTTNGYPATSTPPANAPAAANGRNPYADPRSGTSQPATRSGTSQPVPNSGTSQPATRSGTSQPVSHTSQAGTRSGYGAPVGRGAADPSGRTQSSRSPGRTSQSTPSSTRMPPAAASSSGMPPAAASPNGMPPASPAAASSSQLPPASRTQSPGRGPQVNPSAGRTPPAAASSARMTPANNTQSPGRTQQPTASSTRMPPASPAAASASRMPPASSGYPQPASPAATQSGYMPAAAQSGYMPPASPAAASGYGGMPQGTPDFGPTGQPPAVSPRMQPTGYVDSGRPSLELPTYLDPSQQAGSPPVPPGYPSGQPGYPGQRPAEQSGYNGAAGYPGAAGQRPAERSGYNGAVPQRPAERSGYANPAAAPGNGEQRGRRASVESGYVAPVGYGGANPVDRRSVESGYVAPVARPNRHSADVPNNGGPRHVDGQPVWQQNGNGTGSHARPDTSESASGSHAAGRSVSDLLATHGGTQSPRRHRRRED